MNTALKAALLSGLVFPGLGQIVLRRYMRGVLILMTVVVSMLVFVVKAVLIALDILKTVNAEGGVVSMNAIIDAAATVSGASGSLSLNMLLLVMAACWLIGIVDAYRIGRNVDRADHTSRHGVSGNG